MLESDLKKLLQQSEPEFSNVDEDAVVKLLSASAERDLIRVHRVSDNVVSMRQTGQTKGLAVFATILSLLACFAFGWQWRASEQNSVDHQIAEIERASQRIKELTERYEELDQFIATVPPSPPMVSRDDIRAAESLWMLKEADDVRDRIDTDDVILAYFGNTPAARRCRELND